MWLSAAYLVTSFPALTIPYLLHICFCIRHTAGRLYHQQYVRYAITEGELFSLSIIHLRPKSRTSTSLRAWFLLSLKQTKFTAKVCKRMLQIRAFVLDIYWTGHDILPLSIADTNFRLKVDNDLRGYFVSCKEPLTACRQPGRRQAGACLGRWRGRAQNKSKEFPVTWDRWQ